jgi:hypothetical protein
VGAWPASLAPFWLGVMACADPPPAPVPSDATVMTQLAEALVEQAPAVADDPVATPTGDPVEIVFVWTGIGALHRSFFQDAAAFSALSRELGGLVVGPANIQIRHDNENFIGQIRLELREGTRLLPVRVDGDKVRLQDLAPITTALAHYRSAISGNYDMRVASFSIGIEATSGTSSCVFGVAGVPPPDGRILSPCVEINGIEECGTPSADGVSFSPSAAGHIRTCLRL